MARASSAAGRYRIRPSSRRPSPRSSTCPASAMRVPGDFRLRRVRRSSARGVAGPFRPRNLGGQALRYAQVLAEDRKLHARKFGRAPVTALRLLLELGNILSMVIDHVTPHLAVERAPA